MALNTNFTVRSLTIDNAAYGGITAFTSTSGSSTRLTFAAGNGIDPSITIGTTTPGTSLVPGSAFLGVPNDSFGRLEVRLDDDLTIADDRSGRWG
jgi:hypothetical protein